MKIEKPNNVHFKSLSYGDVFHGCGGYCLRIPSIITTEPFERKYNAFNLDTSQLTCFALDDFVEKVNCKLVIE